MSGQSPNRRNHLQFGIRGLCVTCCSVAVGLVAAKSAPLPWSTALFAVVAFWCMWGLTIQAVDLCSALRTSAHATADVRCGWRIGILWRRGLFIGRTWAWRRAPVPVATMRLPCTRFVVVWLALFVALASAGVALAWLSFAVWLTPWASL